MKATIKKGKNTVFYLILNVRLFDIQMNMFYSSYRRTLKVGKEG